MKPVDQKHMRDVDAGIWGDCQSAVIASLLELPLEDVPHFAQEADGDVWEFREKLQAFCFSHGYLYAEAHNNKTMFAFGCDHDVYHAISGTSPRGNGLHHCVVGKNGQIEHDPHPSRAGLAGEPSEWTFAYLVKA